MKINTYKPYFLLLLLSLFGWNGFSQSNTLEQDFNSNWKFHLGGLEFAETSGFNDKLWKTVNIPHTWNAKDPFDDDLTYVRGIAWYRKTFNLNEADTAKKITIHFEGVFQVADVYINGAFIGRHKGGYTAFDFDISKKINPGKNVIAVKVNSSQDPFIPPLSIGYTGYGGIYRPIKLIFKDDIHFEGKYASSGIKISTPIVSKQNTKVCIEANIFNESVKEQNIKVVHQIFNTKQELVKTLAKAIKVAPNMNATINLEVDIANPELWNPENPYLYHVKSMIELDGKTIDKVENSLGLRWFSFSADKGFSLNGTKYILKGTNRHQDMEGKGDALSRNDHVKDFKIIKEMGCNFVRLAHYPQSQDVLNLADSLGLLIWEETPLVNYMTINPEFLTNSTYMIEEMIHQNYNHPSVIIWGSMNEILLWSQDGYRIQNHDKEKEYVKEVQKYAVKLDSVVKANDPSRYSVIAMHMSNEYPEFNIEGIAQINAFNIYSGWYSGKVEEFGSSIDKKHQERPNEILFISEYGAEGDARINSSQAKRLDFSGQYQRYYHEAYLKQINERPWLAGTAIWNQFDFSQPNIGGTKINFNQKGLVDWNRKPKDSYYLYKANWNPNPMIYIASRDWKQRSGNLNQKSEVEVYSNLKKITLQINGENTASKKPNAIKKVTYLLALKQGNNFIKVRGYAGKKLISDTLTINYKPNFVSGEAFKALHVNIGAKAQYLDADGTIWVEDQPYKNGSFGFTGGENMMMGLKKLIASTKDVPLYYSYLEGIESYQVDLPQGKYQLSLGFVEPESLATGERVFDIYANGKMLVKNLDLTAEAGKTTALEKTFAIDIKNNEGLKLNFKALKGKTLLSNLSLEKITKNNENSILSSQKK